MGRITMKVRAINWTMGNHGSVWLQLREGECRVDWGDGHTSSIKAPLYQDQNNKEWVYARHEYHKSCMETEQVFDVSISSEELVEFSRFVTYIIQEFSLQVDNLNNSQSLDDSYFSMYFQYVFDKTLEASIKNILGRDEETYMSLAEPLEYYELDIPIHIQESLNRMVGRIVLLSNKVLSYIRERGYDKGDSIDWILPYFLTAGTLAIKWFTGKSKCRFPVSAPYALTPLKAV